MLVKVFIFCVIKNMPNKIKKIPKSFIKDKSSLKKTFPEIVIRNNLAPVIVGYAVLRGILLSDCKIK